MHVSPRDPRNVAERHFSSSVMDPTQLVLSYTGQGPYAPGGQGNEGGQEENANGEQQVQEGG